MPKQLTLVGAHSRKLASIIWLALACGTAASCSTSGAGEVRGNESGSAPINENEAVEYQKAINRCHRTGGTRVVKIKGELRCF